MRDLPAHFKAFLAAIFTAWAFCFATAAAAQNDVALRTDTAVTDSAAAGGYRLARPASAISVAEVVAAIDGDIGLTQCSVHVDECAHTNYCPTRPHWHRINAAVIQALARQQIVAGAQAAETSLALRYEPNRERLEY